MNRFAFLLSAIMFCGGALPVRAPQPAIVETQPYPAIRIETRADAVAKQHILIARVDLSDTHTFVRVARGGDDPDGDGPYQTTLLTPSVIAAREGFALTINGDFFSARATRDAEGAQSGFTTGKWASVVGPAVTDGIAWATASHARPVLVLDKNKRAQITTSQTAPAGARQVIAGSDLLLQNGEIALDNATKFAINRHPRTAVGLSDGGKTLVLVVVDGRDSQSALGMTLIELADLMRGLGCTDALNLDGGGSSEMLLRDTQTRQLRVLNAPSDGRERAVANVLGVSVEGK